MLTGGVEFPHVNSPETEWPHFIHPPHNLSDLLIAFIPPHPLYPILLIHISNLEHQVLQHLIHSRHDLLRVLLQLTIQLLRGRVREEVGHVEIEVRVPCLTHSAEVGFVQGYFAFFGGGEDTRGEA